MGCSSEEDLPRLVEDFQQEMRNDPHVVWIKVVDKVSGRMIAASQWKVFPNFAPVSSDDQPAAWLVGETKEKAANMMQIMNERRRKANPGGSLREC